MTSILIFKNSTLSMHEEPIRPSTIIDERTASYNEIYGEGNYLITPRASLPADFSVDTYTIVDGRLVPAPAELIAEREAVKAKAAALVEIKELQAYLTSTDYAAIKCGELGASMVDSYPDLHAGRTAARARINELQELYATNI